MVKYLVLIVFFLKKLLIIFFDKFNFFVKFFWFWKLFFLRLILILLIFFILICNKFGFFNNFMYELIFLVSNLYFLLIKVWIVNWCKIILLWLVFLFINVKLILICWLIIFKCFLGLRLVINNNKYDFGNFFKIIDG